MNAEQFSKVTDILFQRHYGVTINDTFASSPAVIADCIRRGTRPFDVVNEEAEDNQYTRIDIDSWLASALISAGEEGAVLKELGIDVPNATQGSAAPSL